MVLALEMSDLVVAYFFIYNIKKCDMINFFFDWQFGFLKLLLQLDYLGFRRMRVGLWDYVGKVVSFCFFFQIE